MDPNLAQQTGASDADGMVLALELVITPTIFGFLGYLLDGALGTLPVFTLCFGAFTLCYSVWKLVVNYNARMEAELQGQDGLFPGRSNA